MGRPSQGWKLHRKPGRRCHSVRFTHAGREYDLGTGEEDESLAARRAAEIYAGVVSGTHAAGRGKGPSARALAPVAFSWLESLTLDPVTVEAYTSYCDVHFVPFFGNVENITSAKVGDYLRARLKKVLAATVKKELGALRQLCEFAFVRVDFPKVSKKTVGTRHKQGGRARVALSPAEVALLIDALPERKKRYARTAGAEKTLTAGQPELGWPVRARYRVMYETSLRPETLDLLSVPEHFTPGASHLTITDEIDKARFGRSLPLSSAARAALETVAPAAGLVFGHFTNRKLIRAAALKAGIDAARAGKITPYDLRRACLTHLADAGKLTAAQWMAGHKRISTTAIYAQGSLRAAEEAIR